MKKVKGKSTIFEEAVSIYKKSFKKKIIPLQYFSSAAKFSQTSMLFLISG